MLGVLTMKISRTVISPPASGHSVHRAGRPDTSSGDRHHTRRMWLLSTFTGLSAVSLIWALET